MDEKFDKLNVSSDKPKDNSKNVLVKPIVKFNATSDKEKALKRIIEDEEIELEYKRIKLEKETTRTRIT